MPDHAAEPGEVTIKKLDIAWELTQKAVSTRGVSRLDNWDHALNRFRAAYFHISETVEGTKPDQE